MVPAVLGRAPRRLPFGWCTWRGPDGGDAVALTFDDGPTADSRRTLEILDAFDLRATFFVLGALAERSPSLVQEMIGRGHGVASHGYHHEHHLARTPGWIERDIRRSVAALGEVGVAARHFRPPYGQLQLGTVVAARRAGLETVLWSVWGREFADRDSSRILERITSRLRPGAIICLHDSDACAPNGTAARTHAVLPRLAEALAEHGLKSVPVDELLSPPGSS